MPPPVNTPAVSCRLTALVTRSSVDAAGLAAALDARGIAVLLEPLLEIVHRDDVHPDLDGVQALLFTSANGVRAFAGASGERAMPVFAVGEATAACARDAGFGLVNSANGDVVDLAGLTVARLRPEAGRLLHIAGSVVAGDLAAALAGKGFIVDRVVLYEARKATIFSDTTVNALSEGAVDLALFFSPRTAEIFARLVEHHGLPETLRRVSAIAISEAAAAALATLPFRARLVAARPNQASLLGAVDAYVSERCNS